MISTEHRPSGRGPMANKICHAVFMHSFLSISNMTQQIQSILPPPPTPTYTPTPTWSV